MANINRFAHRPLPISLANGVGRVVKGLVGRDIAPLEASLFVDQADYQTCIRLGGADDLIEGLEIFLKSLHSEADLNLIGRVIAKSTITSAIKTRRSILEWRSHNTELAASQNIVAPIFIAGLPRTGTSFLHLLLSADPDNRSPLSWEVANPVPPPSSTGSPSLVQSEQKKINGLLQLCPDFNSVHPIGSVIPQECVAIFASNMMSGQFDCMFHIPSYMRWLDSRSFVDSYKFHKLFLQTLQSGAGWTDKRWLLKSPCHLNIIPDMLSVYPDAKIIQTHRNPGSVVASTCSMISMLRSVSSDGVNLKDVGAENLDRLSGLLNTSMDHRKDEKINSAIVDIKMNDLVLDPISCIEKIYDHFAMHLSGTAVDAMRLVISANPKEKHGVHLYNLEEFGLSKSMCDSAFSNYISMYDL